MLSDNERMKKLKGGSKRAVTARGHTWSDAQKIEAAQTYILIGSLRQAALALKIPEITIRVWAGSQWWKDLVSDLRSQENMILNNKLKKIADKSLELVMDRLEHGDYIYDQKAGKLIRKPVTLREINKVATDMLTQKAKIKNDEESAVAQENIQNKLEQLAKSFEQFANKADNKPPVNVTDVVFIEEGTSFDAAPSLQEGELDALYEERETRLQEGERAVQQSPISEKGTQ